MPNYFYYEVIFKDSAGLKGNSFTQTSGKGKGRNIWFDKEKIPLNFTLILGKSYIIKCQRDLDSETIKSSEDRKINNFFIAEINWFENKKTNSLN